ncbi:MAG: histone deacetylase [Cyanobacteria bacterium P01_F01_bin.150]
MFPIFYSDEFLEHQTGRWHPECPGRLTAIKKHLESMPWADQLEWRSPTPIDQQPTNQQSINQQSANHQPANQKPFIQQSLHPHPSHPQPNHPQPSPQTANAQTLKLPNSQTPKLPNSQTPRNPNAQASDRLQTAIAEVHPSEHVALIRQLAVSGGGAIDPDTIVSPRSYDVAQLAVSAWLDGVDTVLSTQRPAFALVRPPGHHAEARRAMGFCLFSNAAIAALYALEKSGIERVAILDWDVHHGNGTQSIVEHNPRIKYCSLHEFPHYPGTGSRSEKGEFDNVLNIPMVAGSTIEEYTAAFQDKVMPFLTSDRLDLLLVSAGYDAAYADPLAHIALNPEDFSQLTRYCTDINQSVLFGLEGGYDFNALAAAVAATIEPCLEIA